MRTYFCPFWRREKVSELSSTCDGATISFATNEVRRGYVYGYCAHPDGWEQCPIYKILLQEASNAKTKYNRCHR